MLIGGFRDVNAASSELKKVRKMDLPDIKLKSGKPAFDTYDVYEPTSGSKSFELKALSGQSVPHGVRHSQSDCAARTPHRFQG